MRTSNLGINKRIKKSLLVLLAVIIVMFVLYIAVFMLIKNMEKSRSRLELPPSGEYYCEELGATLQAENSRYFLQLKDGRVQEIYPTMSGRINGESREMIFDFCAKFEWDKKNDWIEMKIEKYPESFQLGKVFIFKKV